MRQLAIPALVTRLMRRRERTKKSQMSAKAARIISAQPHRNAADGHERRAATEIGYEQRAAKGRTVVSNAGNAGHIDRVVVTLKCAFKHTLQEIAVVEQIAPVVGGRAGHG